MQTTQRAEAPLLPLFLLWARYHLSARLAALGPNITAEQAAAAAALSNNPSGS